MSENIAHDLTLLIVKDTCTDKTPESVVTAYYETLPQVKEAVNKYLKEHRKPTQVLNRSDFPI